MYTLRDLDQAYVDLGIRSGDTVFVTSSLVELFTFEKADRLEALAAHLTALEDAVGRQGTIVMPAASLQICNTDVPFDLNNTPSTQVGALAEFMRIKEYTYRSFHPFVSFTARGYEARDIVSNCSRFAFGYDSPMGRILDRDAKCISIGKHPRFTATLIHHVEQLVSVPYRYTKEFIHPVYRGGRLVEEPFYMYVLYRNSDVQRSFNQELFSLSTIDELVVSAPVGRGRIYSYPMRLFRDRAIKALLNQLYIWCKEPPAVRPWQT